MRSSMPPWPPRSVPVSFTSMSRFRSDSKRSPSGAATAIDDAEDDRLADREEMLVVERDERDEHRREPSRREPLPRLPRRGRRRQLVAPDQPAAEVGERVARPHREQHGDRREASVVRKLPQQDEEREAAADPHRAHHRAADRDRRRRARLRDRLQDERERERREEPADHPADAAHLRPDERERRTDVPGRRERRERPREQPELVQRDAASRAPRGRTPTSRRGRRPGARSAADRGHEEPRQPVAHRPPNLRRRDAYSARAARRSRSSKSGHSGSANTSSV